MVWPAGVARMIRDMSPSERRAYDLGVRAAIDAARIVAITIETAEDADSFRKRVAAETMVAFAEAAEGLKLAQVESPANTVMRAITADPAAAGTLAYPTCAGRVSWARDSSNGHIHARCEARQCFAIMQ